MKIVEPGELTSSLKGRDALHQQLETVFKNAKSDISVLTTSKGLQELEKRHYNLLKKASQRGVKIRIASDSVGRFAVVDGSHIVMSLTDEKVHPTQDTALWSQSPHVAENLLCPMFEMVWKQSKE